MSNLLARPIAPRRLADERALVRATAQKRLMIMMLLYGAAIGVVVAKLSFLRSPREPRPRRRWPTV